MPQEVAVEVNPVAVIVVAVDRADAAADAAVFPVDAQPIDFASLRGKRVAVIGAGISGLTAGKMLKDYGVLTLLCLLPVYVVLGLVSLLVLSAELGGVCVALELGTGVGFQWWAIPGRFREA